MTLPTVQVEVGGRTVRALVDSGCSQTVLSKRLAERVGRVDSGKVHVVEGINGEKATGWASTIPVIVQQ